MNNQTAHDILKNWPQDSQEAAQLVIDKYGEPDEATESMLIWHCLLYTSGSGAARPTSINTPMSKHPASPAPAPPAQHESWFSMVIIVLAQFQMAFNVNAIPVSMGPIVEELGIPATSVGTALVVYSLFVAAFVMVGSKLGKILGARLVFQVTALLHGCLLYTSRCV